MNNILKSDDFKNKMIEIEKNDLDSDILKIRINSIKKREIQKNIIINILKISIQYMNIHQKQ